MDKHLKHFKELLARLARNNITLNLSKSNFFRKEKKFLGFILAGGIKPDPEKGAEESESDDRLVIREACKEIIRKK